MHAEAIIRRLTSEIGITINGDAASDIHVHNPRFYARVLAYGSLGLGESYMEGDWDCADLAHLHYLIGRYDVHAKWTPSWRLLLQVAKARLLNLQSRRRSGIVAARHYDITVDLYRRMTDKWMTLSCGYWKNAHTLLEAQEAKLDLICKKINLSPGDRVLDVGCGFGSFVRYATEHYDCHVTGINVSAEQVKVARELCHGLPAVIHHCDYRQTETFRGDKAFDKAVSAGMFEHVGLKNHRMYMNVVHECLRDGGSFLLHTIGSNVSSFHNDLWFDKYIFPNALVPSLKQIVSAAEGVFVVEDCHNFGPDYARTLKSWFDNFDASWTESRDDSFYRMWKYFLLAGEGGFRARQKQLWQVLLSKGGLPAGYTLERQRP
jgi:cyclopropane-fatty-acyl-phospholipid synthase